MATANGNATAEQAQAALSPVALYCLLPPSQRAPPSGGREVAPTYANTSGTAAREFSGSGSFAALEQFYCRLKVCLRSLA